MRAAETTTKPCQMHVKEVMMIYGQPSWVESTSMHPWVSIRKAQRSQRNDCSFHTKSDATKDISR